MGDHRAVMQQALEKLESSAAYEGFPSVRRAAEALRTALAADERAEGAEPADPLDWPLPCSVTVGNVMIAKGCALRTLVARLEALHRSMMESARPANTRPLEEIVREWEADPVKAAALDQARRERAAGAEPFAWAHPDGRVVPAATMAAAKRDGGAMLSSLAGYTIPLYPPAKRVPLTEDQIVMDGLMMLPNEDAKDCAKSFTAGVRFAERAHGIKED